MTRQTILRPRDRKALDDAIYDAGLTARTLGEQVGVTRQHISAVLRGDRGCRPATANAIAQALGRALDEIFTADPSEDSDNTREDLRMPPTATGHDDPILLAEDVAAALRISKVTLYKRRRRGELAPPMEMRGGRLVIRQRTLDRWLDEEYLPSA